MTKDPQISIIVPIFNEEQNIGELYEALCSNIDFSELILVDDGSTDQSISKIKELRSRDERVRFLSFSRNFGHQNAIKAGLDHCNGDCAITMDGDLQHPPSLIPEMIAEWKKGSDIVISIRKDSKKQSRYKRATSSLFYKLNNLLSDTQISPGSADFRLLDRKVIDVIAQMKETPVFFRGMVSWLGFSQSTLTYSPDERKHGSSKYSGRKMLGLSLEGITSFSIKPLRIASFTGFFIALLSLIYGIYAICIKLFTAEAVDGWASLLAMIAFMGGMQMIMIGIIGEYLGKLFLSSKGRPSYIIKERS